MGWQNAGESSVEVKPRALRVVSHRAARGTVFWGHEAGAPRPLYQLSASLLISLISDPTTPGTMTTITRIAVLFVLGIALLQVRHQSKNYIFYFNIIELRPSGGCAGYIPGFWHPLNIIFLSGYLSPIKMNLRMWKVTTAKAYCTNVLVINLLIQSVT